MLGFGIGSGLGGQQDVAAGGESFGVSGVGDEQIVECRAGVDNSQLPPRGQLASFLCSSPPPIRKKRLQGRSSSGIKWLCHDRHALHQLNGERSQRVSV
jgi:hypothetical protein